MNQTPTMKSCFVNLSKNNITMDSPKALKKCVVFLDKDSVIEDNVIRKRLRATSIPTNRPARIEAKRNSVPKHLEAPLQYKNRLATVCEPVTPKVQPALASELKRAIDEKNLLTTKTKSKFMSALSELERENEEEIRKNRKNKALQEVLSSEKVYIKQLETIINYFQSPIKERNLLICEDIEVIFGGLGAIYNLNKELLQMLENDSKNVGGAFIKIAPFFKLYSSYAYDFKNILQLIEKNQDTNEDFQQFIQNQESRPEVQSKLSSLLITPIQRIPRYCLLLRQVLDYTTLEEDDYDDIKESLEEVEKSAKHIDMLVEQKENSERLIEIQNLLVDNKPILIKPGRNLIHEGTVIRTLPLSPVTVIYVVLLSDIILFCKIKKHALRSKNSLKCFTIYPIKMCKIKENSTARKIHVSCDEESIEIYVEKQKDFETWRKCLRETIEKAIEGEQSLRKEYSIRKPAHNKDFAMYEAKDVTPAQKQIKRKFSDTYKDEKLPENTDSATKRFRVKGRDPIDRKDSLFPLRKHFLTSGKQQKKENQTKDEFESTGNNVFVFGNPQNENQGFNFKFTNFFCNIGHSILRLFGYNNNN